MIKKLIKLWICEHNDGKDIDQIIDDRKWHWPGHLVRSSDVLWPILDRWPAEEYGKDPKCGGMKK